MGDTDSIAWSVRQVLGGLILPPGILLVLIAAGLWQGRSHRWARWMAGTSLTLLFLISLTAVGYLMAAPFESAWPPVDPSAVKRLPADRSAIVVLGGGRTLGALEYGERETLSNASLRRAVFASQLSERTGLPLVVVGGKPTGGALSEAALIRKFIESDARHRVALIEDQSRDTRQNADNLAKALAPGNTRTLVIVTDVLHMPRAVRAFRSAGFTVVPAPLHFQASAPLNAGDFVPSIRGLELSCYAIRELAGDIWYRFRRLLQP